SQPFVGAGGGQADVHNSHIRPVPCHRGQQRRAVRNRRGHVEAGLGEQSRHALAQQRVVLGDDYPHGSSARIVVPRPIVLSTICTPPSAVTRITSPHSPEPRSGSAPPRPSSPTMTASRSPSRIIRPRPRSADACLSRLASPSATT